MKAFSNIRSTVGNNLLSVIINRVKQLLTFHALFSMNLIMQGTKFKVNPQFETKQGELEVKS